MSDWYQTIADLDVDEASAKALAARLREWMISQRIIEPNETDCVLGKYLGHAPSGNYTIAAEKSPGYLFETRPNGVAFIAERTVFYSAGLADITLVCAACGARFPSGDTWSSAVDDWFVSKGPGFLACLECDTAAPITEWQHDPPWAFGCLGIEFWNWPALRPEFITEVSKQLDHRVRLVRGKI